MRRNIFGRLLPERRPTSELSRQEVMARSIGSRVLWIQQGWANWMQRWTQKISKEGRIALLVAFLFVGLSFCLCMVLGKRIQLGVLGSGQVYSVAFGDRHTGIIIARQDERELVLKGIYRHLLASQKFLDSLKLTPAGREQLREISLRRPGMIDSINMAEKALREQLKIKERTK
ncbi:hypothetical protein [Olivibacter domesticus]|uniref:Uncharacterized protein n=1 Tax=Olivibacter domesticus TaxID=407022 RepID=A0A1H7IB70_OLID1|nr:hypothetical protein [Olivibacter domesticus]SEK58770.1 hypothetical protein SAMN05661044_00618 [Olivibacter domesticus]